MKAWISGSFCVYDYFYTQYLFSAITILAISKLWKGTDGSADAEDFETGTELLDELKQNGNFAAVEFTRHIDAMRHTQEHSLWKPECAAAEPSSMAGAEHNVDNGSLLTAGMALTEPSLQEFLAQPELDLSFMNVDMSNEGSQRILLPDFDRGSWMPG